jgi:hypothetical protein
MKVFTYDVDLEQNVCLIGSKLNVELMNWNVTFEIHVAMGVKIMVSSCVTPCSLADGYYWFRQTSVGLERAFFCPEDGDSSFV